MTDNQNEPNVEPELLQFDFDEWAHNAGLSRKATAVLRQEDLTTRRTLVLLKLCDVRSLNLQLGQTKLLEAAVNELNTMDKMTTPVAAANDAEGVAAPVGLPRTGDTATEMDSLTLSNLRLQAGHISASGELLDNLLKDVTSPEKTSQNSRPNSETTSYSGFDPRVNLTVKSKNNKAVHITQFLSERSRKRRISKQKELVLSSATDSDQLSLVKLDDDHPYAGIFLSEWASANMRLMAHLRQIGRLPDDQTDYYLSYTVTILDFSDSYTWSSILSFDHMYREMQAAHNLQWGVISPTMQLQLLVPKNRLTDNNPLTPGANNSSKRQINSSQQKTGEICRMFTSRGYCNFGEKCRYRHVKAVQPPAIPSGDASKNA